MERAAVRDAARARHVGHSLEQRLVRDGVRPGGSPAPVPQQRRRAALHAPVSAIGGRFLRGVHGGPASRSGSRCRFTRSRWNSTISRRSIRTHHHASYDTEYVERFRRILINSDRIFKQFRSRFLGKSSPVHFFWGSFDLAVTRFSGRRAPEREGVDAMMREAYSHEVTSCGFWPGNRVFPHSAFYAYSAPVPPGLEKEPVRPAAAGWNSQLGEFIFKYEDARSIRFARSGDPRFLPERVRGRSEAGAMGSREPGTAVTPRANSRTAFLNTELRQFRLGRNACTAAVQSVCL